MCVYLIEREREGEEREVRSENVCERYSVHLREREGERINISKNKSAFT